MSDTVQTDYARAAAGFDEQFRDALMAEIIGTVAERSVLTDARHYWPSGPGRLPTPWCDAWYWLVLGQIRPLAI